MPLKDVARASRPWSNNANLAGKLMGETPMPRRLRAFTLVELLVVMAIVAVVLAMVLPSMIGLFSTGSEKQSRTVVSSVMATARGLAIEKQVYTLVHVQMGPDASGKDKCWAVIMQLDPTLKEIDASGGRNAPSRTFVPADGMAPRQLSGDIALGQISEDWVYLDHFLTIRTDDLNEDSLRIHHQLRFFTDFNVIFSPDGSAVRTVNGRGPLLSNKVYRCDGGGKHDPNGNVVCIFKGPDTPVQNTFPPNTNFAPAVLWSSLTMTGGVAIPSADGYVGYNYAGTAVNDQKWLTDNGYAGMAVFSNPTSNSREFVATSGPLYMDLDFTNLKARQGVMAMTTFSYAALKVLRPALNEAPYSGFVDPTKDSDSTDDGTAAGVPSHPTPMAATRAWYLTNQVKDTSKVNEKGTALFISINPYTGRLIQEP